ncbi:uncharacterized protein LOC117172339 [Belonocnema kinseyi]|uniref:uncharacterized protein LOC117172339 n=1 Tax=Belonocnema kinseyi TaxID=2817044 RepID=UPI00143CD24D|nr:uncharacterized protein LOC117172339 [Belonocnema kinseyi]
MSVPVLLSDLNDKFQNSLTVDATRTPVEDDLLDRFDLTVCPSSKNTGDRPRFSSSSSASQSRQSESSECKFDPTSDIKFPSGRSNDQPDDDADADSGGKKKNHGYKPRKPNRTRATNAGGIIISHSQNIKIAPKTSYTCNIIQHGAETSTVPPKSKTVISMPKNIKDLLECKEEISKKDMLLIKRYMGSGWRDVARKLNYTDGEIQQFQANFRSEEMDEIVYQILLDWKQMNSKDAKLGILVEAMWSSREYDCVYKLAESRKDPS